MVRDRFLLECPHCGKGKLIDVAVSSEGMIGPVKCDDCKARDLLHRTMPRASPRRNGALTVLRA
jgi:transcription elongation factor Elf1